MSYVPYADQLRGLDYASASLYGMPHLGAGYYADDVNATRWVGEQRRCAACGRSTGFHSKHHEPPKSKGRSFLLCTPMGQFVLKPAIIDLCGTGTTGCHGDRHNGLLAIRWEWDSDESAEQWWNGYLLSHGYVPHDPRLFVLGRYIIERGGVEMEVRGWR